MPNPTFVKGATTITFSSGNSYGYPYPDPVAQPVQAKERTAGGSKYITDKADSKRTFVLDFPVLSSSTISSLRSFYTTDVVGAKNTFTFNDHNATVYTVRWMNEWNFVEFTKGYFRGQIVLEEE